MSLTIIKQPPLISLSGDPMIVKVLTTNNIETDGTKSIVRIVFSSQLPQTIDPIIFTLIIDEYELTYKFVNSNPGYGEFLIPQDNSDLPYLYEDIYNEMLSDLKLTSIFDVTFELPYIELQTKKTGPIEHIYFESSELAGVYYATDGNSPVYVENYALRLKVYDPYMRQMVETIGYPDKEGFCDFNLQQFVEHLPVSEFDLDADTFKITKLSQRYSFQISDGIDTLLIRNKIVLKGKSSHLQLAKYNAENRTFYNDLLLNKSFLTLQPNNKKISYSSPQLLFWPAYNYYDINSYKLRTTILYADASTYEFDSGLFEVDNGVVVQVNVSPTHLQIKEKYPDKKVYSYTVKLLGSNNTVFTEERTFIIDYDTYDYLRFFIFESDFGGGFDTMRATGKAVNKGKITKDFGKKYLPTDFVLRDRQETVLSTERQIEFELNWGLLSKNGGSSRDWKNYIQQIELSKNAFEYIKGLIIPCVFSTEEYELHSDDTNYYTHESVYRRAFIDEAFSNDDIPIVGDFTDDYNDDFYS